MDSWSNTLLAASPACSLCLFEHRLPVCVTALPCLALLDRTCRARESTLTTAFRPALPHPVRQSVSQSVARRLALLLARPTDRPGSDFSTTSPESSARAGPDIYPLPVASSPPVISSTSPHLRQSRLHHPATPPPTTTRQPDQPFACGRPIHLATSPPSRRADFCSYVA